MPTKRTSILLVEDSERDIVTIKQGLKHAGIKKGVHVVEDGQKAIHYLSGSCEYKDRRRHPIPALVFLGLKLPLLSGDDVLTWIRQSYHLASTPVVVLASSEKPEDLKRAYQLGASSYLVKPLTADEIADELIEMAEAFNWRWLGCGQLAPACIVLPKNWTGGLGSE